MTKNNVDRKAFVLLTSYIAVHHRRKSGQELKKRNVETGTDARATKECSIIV